MKLIYAFAPHRNNQMKFRERRKDVVIGLAIALLALPTAFGITLVMMPTWLWIEKQTGLESAGHSGPAGWCYLTTYFVIVGGCALLWSANVRRRDRDKEGDRK